MSAVVNHLWQSTVCAVVIGLLTLLLGQNGAHVRYRLWLAASLKFLVPVVFLTFLGAHLGAHLMLGMTRTPMTALIREVAQPVTPSALRGVPVATSDVAALSDAASDRSPLPKPMARARAWAPMLLLAVWVCGFLGVFGYWARRSMRIRAAVKSAVPLDIEAPIPVLEAESSLEPGLVGFVRPILLLPSGIADRLTKPELKAVLAHEFCHLRRRDNLAALLHMLVEALFWFHPLVWWIGARLIDERERACDEAVVASGNDPQDYAQGILKICRFYVESPVACASGVTGANLKRRIEGIVSGRVRLAVGFARKAVLVGVLGAVGFGLYAGAGGSVTAASVPAATGTGRVLVFRDSSSWNRERDFEQVLKELGLPFDVKPSAEMATAPLVGYDTVVIPGWQVTTGGRYYKNFAANADLFDRYVRGGGTLVVEMNGAERYGMTLPGGATMVAHPAFDNIITVSDHPIFAPLAGKPRITASVASHGYIADSPAGALILIAEMRTGQMTPDIGKPTFVEYDYGKGHVLAAAQCFHDRDGSGRGPLMSTLLRYAASRQWVDAETIPAAMLTPAPASAFKVDSAVFDRYAGYYNFEQNAWIILISREGNRYFVRPDAEEKTEIFPVSEREYFSKVNDLRYTFEPGVDGAGVSLRLHTRSRDIVGQRMDSTLAAQSVASLEARIKTNTPYRDTEAALRHQINSFENNAPDYDGENPLVQEAVRTQFLDIKAYLGTLGAMQAIQFRKVTSSGDDVYDVTFEHGTVNWWIKLDDSGKVVMLRYQDRS
jgi:beta-lactamase regulating signal transducer with metallopeptidase domain